MIIKARQIQATNWRIGWILEDVRRSSPTCGKQFEIEDYVNGDIYLRMLDRSEELKPEFIHSRIRG